MKGGNWYGRHGDQSLDRGDRNEQATAPLHDSPPHEAPPRTRRMSTSSVGWFALGLPEALAPIPHAIAACIPRLGRFVLELARIEVRVQPAHAEQLIVGSFLGDVSVGNDQDAVGVADR